MIYTIMDGSVSSDENPLVVIKNLFWLIKDQLWLFHDFLFREYISNHYDEGYSDEDEDEDDEEEEYDDDDEEMLIDIERYIIEDDKFFRCLTTALSKMDSYKQSTLYKKIVSIIQADLDILEMYDVFGDEFILNMMKLQMNMLFSIIKNCKEKVPAFPKPRKKKPTRLPPRPQRQWIPNSGFSPKVNTANSHDMVAVESNYDKQYAMEAAKRNSVIVGDKMLTKNKILELQSRENDLANQIVSNLSRLNSIEDVGKILRRPTFTIVLDELDKMMRFDFEIRHSNITTVGAFLNKGNDIRKSLNSLVSNVGKILRKKKKNIGHYKKQYDPIFSETKELFKTLKATYKEQKKEYKKLQK